MDNELVDTYGGNGSGKRGYARTPCLATCALCVLSTTKAVEQGLTEQKEPFVNVFTGISRTRKRSIEKADINKLRAVQVKPGSFMQLVRDVFFVLLLCLRHAFCGCGFPEEIADKGWHAFCVSPA